ncbi:MAG: AtpZ/AtpI family protein [Pyrinomonadaceae bacterium]
MADDDQETVAHKSGLIYGAITSLVVSIIVMLGIGWALDRWLGIGPWGIVAGILLGSVVGFYQFIKIISKIS